MLSCLWVVPTPNGTDISTHSKALPASICSFWRPYHVWFNYILTGVADSPSSQCTSSVSWEHQVLGNRTSINAWISPGKSYTLHLRNVNDFPGHVHAYTYCFWLKYGRTHIDPRKGRPGSIFLEITMKITTFWSEINTHMLDCMCEVCSLNHTAVEHVCKM